MQSTPTPSSSTAPPPPPPPPQQTAVETLKDIAEVHRDIFHCFLEKEETFYPVQIFDIAPAPADQHGGEHGRAVQVCTVYQHPIQGCNDLEDLQNAAALRASRRPVSMDPSKVIPLVPKGTDPNIDIAYRKWNQCDLAGSAFFISLEKQIKAHIPGAQLQWLEVFIAPVRIFRSYDVPKAIEHDSVMHSAFLATLPGSAHRYVIDFTIEQYGYTSWFLTETEYHAFRKNDLQRNPDPIATMIEMDREFLPDHKECVHIMRNLCTGIDWPALMGMERMERRNKAISLACEALDVLLSVPLEKYLNSEQAGA